MAPVNSSDQQPVNVRETLEYKKAMELQLWLEEQQALYKTQVHVSRCCICCEDMVAHVHNSVSTEQ